MKYQWKVSKVPSNGPVALENLLNQLENEDFAIDQVAHQGDSLLIIAKKEVKPPPPHD